MPSRICVCGRSATYPVCDDSHEGEDWSCRASPPSARHGFCASHHYRNVASKLAAAHQGIAFGPGDGPAEVDTLVLILGGVDLETPLSISARVKAREKVVICFGRGGGLIRASVPEARVFALDEDDARQAFGLIQGVLAGRGEALCERLSPRSLFLSHAVRDEPLIMPVVEHLKRHYGAEVFTCADSIPSGGQWHDEIMAALRERDLFVMVLSESFVASTFSAFEIGCAFALGKPMAAISVDGVLPPAFIQHLQMADVPRIQRRSPWLDPGDILIDELLSVMLPG